MVTRMKVYGGKMFEDFGKSKERLAKTIENALIVPILIRINKMLRSFSNVLTDFLSRWR